MDKEQFIETCVNSGYCTKSIANQYINENPKVSYDNSVCKPRPDEVVRG